MKDRGTGVLALLFLALASVLAVPFAGSREAPGPREAGLVRPATPTPARTCRTS